MTGSVSAVSKGIEGSGCGLGMREKIDVASCGVPGLSCCRATVP